MIEQLFKAKWFEKKHLVSLYMGIIYTTISFFTSYILFNNNKGFIGLGTLFFVVILTLPSINKLFDFEERLEKTKKGWLEKHESIIDFFIYFFIGVFLVFLIISLINPYLVVSSLNPAAEPIIGKVTSNLPPPPQPANSNLTISIFANNVFVMILCFLLSFFYGSGAIFLITLNASIFASALSAVIRIKAPITGFISFLTCNTSIMFFHMIPELTGYFYAAIAGGVLSKAVKKEKLWSKEFNTIFKDSIIMLILGILILIIAAIIEVSISKKLFHSTICIDTPCFVIITFIIIILALFSLEFFRRRKIHKYLYIKKN